MYSNWKPPVKGILNSVNLIDDFQLCEKISIERFFKWNTVNILNVSRLAVAFILHRIGQNIELFEVYGILWSRHKFNFMIIVFWFISFYKRSVSLGKKLGEIVNNLYLIFTSF